MIIAACVDEAMGLQFNGRRQSRDRLMLDELERLAGGTLRISPASEKLFLGRSVYAGADYLSASAEGDLCFCEDVDYLAFADQIERIILFQWNRSYPADLYFSFPGKWTPAGKRDFAGSSHEKITIEEYVK